MLEVGQLFPDFALTDQEGNPFTKDNLLGHWSVVYFYPKDNTSGCTLEAKEFTCLIDQFQAKKTLVVGVSPDSVKSHANFIASRELSLTLLSDPERVLSAAVGVWRLRKVCGRESYGVVRSSFLLDSQGVVKEVWTNVKAKGHAEAVLAKLGESQK
ncbi:MAG: peroxiredoxin [Deltaproteobacteria bacterium]|jgi:peroxiredoxin Q/BCP|nr:peroxiredoxin [Deltaproteobacteria bacterium]